MKIADLFVNIGMTGGSKTKKELISVKDDLGEVKSMSLEAKAAIIGVFYALDQLITKSAQHANGLAQFATFTGKSAEDLQRWQYAAQQVGVANEEVTGTIKSVQAAMMDMLQGGAVPKGFAMIAEKTHMLTDPEHLRDTLYVMKHINEFIETVPADIANPIAKSMGYTEGMINAARRHVFNKKTLDSAPILNNQVIEGAQDAGVAMANLGTQVEQAMTKFVAGHGKDLVKDLSLITMQIIKMAEALLILGEKSKVFELIAKSAEIIAATLGIMGIGIDDMTGKHKEKDNKKTFGKDSSVGAALSWRDDVDAKALATLKSLVPGLRASDQAMKVDVTPKVKDSNKPTTHTHHVNQNLNFQHDGQDHKKTGDSVKKAVRDAYRQNPAVNVGG